MSALARFLNTPWSGARGRGERGGGGWGVFGYLGVKVFVFCVDVKIQRVGNGILPAVTTMPKICACFLFCFVLNKQVLIKPFFLFFFPCVGGSVDFLGYGYDSNL